MNKFKNILLSITVFVSLSNIKSTLPSNEFKKNDFNLTEDDKRVCIGTIYRIIVEILNYYKDKNFLIENGNDLKALLNKLLLNKDLCNTILKFNKKKMAIIKNYMSLSYFSTLINKVGLPLSFCCIFLNLFFKKESNLINKIQQGGAITALMQSALNSAVLEVKMERKAYEMEKYKDIFENEETRNKLFEAVYTEMTNYSESKKKE